jgi:hypothetical protein
MNKTDRLLQMMEHPQRYTADQWQEILADDECRELYELMSKTQSAVDAARTDVVVTDEMIDAEWQRVISEKTGVKSERYSFLKIASMFVGILMLSGLAYAAFHIVSHKETPKEQPTKAVAHAQRTTINAQVEKSDTIVVPQPKLYDNVPLGEILEELSDFYHVKVVYRNDDASRPRLFYQWRPEYSIGKVVEMLNNFEWLQLELENDTLFVSSTTEPQP